MEIVLYEKEEQHHWFPPHHFSFIDSNHPYSSYQIGLSKFLLGFKRPERESDQSSASRVEVNNSWDFMHTRDTTSLRVA
jgi:hypothetical protein